MAKREVKPEGNERAPYGYRVDGKPRKKPGARRGRQKPEGSGRKPAVAYATPAEVNRHLLPKWAQTAEAILDGKPIRTCGPTGKTITRISTLDERISVLRMIGSKVLPDLSAQAVTADIVTERLEHKNVSDRDLARTVVNILGKARLEAEPEQPPAPEPMRLLTRDKIIENPSKDASGHGWQSLGSEGKGEAGRDFEAVRPGSNLAGASTASGEVDEETNHPKGEPASAAPDDGTASAPPASPKDHRPIYIGDLGSHIQPKGKVWHVFTWNGALHSTHTELQQAITTALELPGPLRRDERPFERMQPRVLRSSPR